MKIIIIRHAEPDYSIDSLTDKGWCEAEMLADYLKDTEMTNIYCSPLGRAKDTASLTLKKFGRKAVELKWLREFDATIIDSKTGDETIPWDWKPKDWTAIDDFYHKDQWSMETVMRDGGVSEEALWVQEGLDNLLEKHGYKREGRLYHAIKPNCDSIVLFCHFAVQCVMLGHLLGISPMVLWHGLLVQPSGVTTLVTEEREEGIAYFRMRTFGEVTHLYVNNEQPSLAGGFSEVYEH